jgi:3-methyladenine DNA glycosylase AlkD
MTSLQQPTAEQVQAALRAVAKPERVEATKRFFQASPGGYSEGDEFLGCMVPPTRQVAKQFRDLPLAEVGRLLESKWHDDRLCALFILVTQYKRADQANKKAIYHLYMTHIARVNNWDLVDSSAPYIVGPYLRSRPEKLKVLQKLADSELLWKRRIAMLATFDYIKDGRADEALMVSEQLLHDKHDLIQKAVGWMLREIGKRVDRSVLLQFLDEHAATMPRTTLRYAIEHLGTEQRTQYLRLKNGSA